MYADKPASKGAGRKFATVVRKNGKITRNEFDLMVVGWQLGREHVMMSPTTRPGHDSSNQEGYTALNLGTFF